MYPGAPSMGALRCFGELVECPTLEAMVACTSLVKPILIVVKGVETLLEPIYLVFFN